MGKHWWFIQPNLQPIGLDQKNHLQKWRKKNSPSNRDLVKKLWDLHGNLIQYLDSVKTKAVNLLENWVLQWQNMHKDNSMDFVSDKIEDLVFVCWMLSIGDYPLSYPCFFSCFRESPWQGVLTTSFGWAVALHGMCFSASHQGFERPLFSEVCSSEISSVQCQVCHLSTMNTIHGYRRVPPSDKLVSKPHYHPSTIVISIINRR